MDQDWDFYFCNIEDKPASIFLDLALRGLGPQEELPELIWLRLYMRNARDDGLSHKDESPILCGVEDSLNGAIARAGIPATYVGRSTSDGCRDFYFYASDRALESELANAMGRHPDYSYEIGGRNDPDWQVYFRFLYPNPREHQMMQNARVVQQLEEHGDGLDAPREVRHWVYFSSDGNRALFLERLSRTGCDVADIHDEGPVEQPYVVNLAKRHAVDLDTMNDEVLRLFDLAIECEGQYDGWETEVQQDKLDSSRPVKRGG